MTLVERILARAGGREEVRPGDIVVAEVDRMIMHDLSGFLTTKVFDHKVALPIAHPERLTMVFDHIFSPPGEQEAEVLQWDRAWAREHGIGLLDSGSGNIHNAAFRRGLVGPGMVVVGSDSHTPVHGVMGAFAAALGNDCHAGMVFPYGKAWFRVPATVRIDLHGDLPPGTTPRDVALWLVKQIGEGGVVYRALEFGGPLVDSWSLFDRWLLPLIAVDVGAKCGYCLPDEKTFAFAESVGATSHWHRLARAGPPGQRAAAESLASRKDLDLASLHEEARYEKRLAFDVSGLGPCVACPPTVGNVKDAREVAGTPIQYAELGGHGGGRLEDIRLAAGVLQDRPVHPDVRFNVVPASREVFTQALKEGLVAKLHAAGATWFPPSTGSNQAVNMGAMAAGEAMISTHSRNFPGRNGSSEAAMYLASALTVAASAATGQITDVRDTNFIGN